MVRKPVLSPIATSQSLGKIRNGGSSAASASLQQVYPGQGVMADSKKCLPHSLDPYIGLGLPRWVELRRHMNQRRLTKGSPECLGWYGYKLRHLLHLVFFGTVSFPIYVLHWFLWRVVGGWFFWLQRKVATRAAPRSSSRVSEPAAGVVNTRYELMKLSGSSDMGNKIQLIYSSRKEAQSEWLPPLDWHQDHPDPSMNGHFSTIVATVRPSISVIAFHREIIHSTFDGARLCLDWSFAHLFYARPPASPGSRCQWRDCDTSCAKKMNKKKPNQVKGVVCLLPGLASSSDSDYVRHLVHYLNQSGYHVAVLNARGMGDTPLDTNLVMTATFTQDLRDCVELALTPGRLKTEFGVAAGPEEDQPLPLFIVGCSLGGGILAKYLAEEGEGVKTKITAAVTYSSPYDFHETFVQMQKPVNMLVYQPILSKGLLRYLRQHDGLIRELQTAGQHPEASPLLKNNKMRNSNNGVEASTIAGATYDSVVASSPHVKAAPVLDGTKKIRTVNEMDELIFAPHSGYGTREMYYSAASCMPQYLNKVEVPLLCIACEDDTICGPPPVDARWEEVIAANPKICFMKFPSGGHLGFLRSYTTEMRIGIQNFLDSGRRSVSLGTRSPSVVARFLLGTGSAEEDHEKPLVTANTGERTVIDYLDRFATN